MWKRDSQYIEAVRAYIATKNTNISAAGSNSFREGNEDSALLSSFEGLFPAVSKTDACRNLEEHILWEEKEELKTTPTLEEEEGSGESNPAPPAAASDSIQNYTSPVLSYVSAVTTDQFASTNNKRLGIDLSRTVLEITATQPLFLEMAHSKGVRKFVTIGRSDLVKAPSSTNDGQHEHTAIAAPIGDRDGIHRAIRETSSCGYETILATFGDDDEVLAPTNQQVAAFLFTVTSCLSKNTTSGAYVLLLSGPDHHLPLHAELMSKCATFGLNYYVADKGTTTSVPREDGIATTKSIIVLKLSHRMDAAGPSMACSIPLNQHIEDRQRHGPTPTKDADETDDDYKQRQSTYGQAKREFQRKFLLTSTHPVVPPPCCPAAIEDDSYLPVFDVVVQGMGLVEALLVVALARSGKRVLHVCGEGHYGSAFASTDLFSFHRDYITANAADEGGLCNLQLFEDNVFTAKKKPETEDEEGQEMTVRITDREKRQFIVDLFPLFHFSRSDLFNLLVDSKVSPNMDMMLVDRVLLLSSKTNEKIASIGDGKERAEGAVSTTTTTTPAQPVKMTARERLAKLRQQKEQAAAAATTTSDITALETSNKEEAATKSCTTATNNVSPSSTLSVEPIPFSRADVFRQQSSTKTPPPTNAFARLTAAAAAGSMGLLEMRKLMKFIRDLEKYMSHQAGVRDDGDSGDEDALQAKIGESKEEGDSEDDVRRLPWQRSTQNPSEPIATFLGRVYGLSDHTRQLLLLGGAIHNSSSRGTTLTEAIDTLALAFSSVGRFDGLVTPFLVPLYGTGELVQTLCTRSASWLSTTILRRCIRTITTPPSPTSNQLTTIELSNGEKVQTKAVVVPNGLLSSNITNTPTIPVPKYHRAILVLSSPLVSWNQLEGLCNDGLAHVDDADQRVQAEEVRASALFPTAVSILPLASTMKKNDTDDTTRSIFIYQLGMSSEHCPYAFQASGRSDRSDRSVPCLVHFVADASNVTREEFDATVASCTIDDCHHQPEEGVQAGVSPAATHVGILRSSILYRVHFTLDGESSVISGGGGVAGYCRVVDSAAAVSQGGGADPHTASSPSSSQGPIFSISTLFDGSKPETLQKQQPLRTTSTSVVMPPVGGGNCTDPSITQSRGATSVLDDGWYAHTAEAAYHRIHQCLYSMDGCKEKVVEEDGDDTSAATTVTHYAYMPFFEEFPDPSDRWYAGHQDAEAPKQGSSDEEEEDQNNNEGTAPTTTTAKDQSQDNSNSLPIGEDSYEDRTLQFLRQQQ